MMNGAQIQVQAQSQIKQREQMIKRGGGVWRGGNEEDEEWRVVTGEVVFHR